MQRMTDKVSAVERQLTAVETTNCNMRREGEQLLQQAGEYYQRYAEIFAERNSYISEYNFIQSKLQYNHRSTGRRKSTNQSVLGNFGTNEAANYRTYSHSTIRKRR
jgi:hypothetical protein